LQDVDTGEVIQSEEAGRIRGVLFGEAFGSGDFLARARSIAGASVEDSFEAAHWNFAINRQRTH